jgi:hypothetical protein
VSRLLDFHINPVQRQDHRQQATQGVADDTGRKPCTGRRAVAPARARVRTRAVVRRMTPGSSRRPAAASAAPRRARRRRCCARLRKPRRAYSERWRRRPRAMPPAPPARGHSGRAPWSCGAAGSRRQAALRPPDRRATASAVSSSKAATSDAATAVMRQRQTNAKQSLRSRSRRGRQRRGHLRQRQAKPRLRADACKRSRCKASRDTRRLPGARFRQLESRIESGQKSSLSTGIPRTRAPHRRRHDAAADTESGPPGRQRLRWYEWRH